MYSLRTITTGCEKPSYKLPTDCNINSQYLNNTSPNNIDWECSSCPLGGSCIGDITWAEVRPKYGWWRLHKNATHPPDCLATNENKKEAQPNCAFSKCLYPDACLGATEFTDKTFNFTERTCNEKLGYSNDCIDEHGETSRCRLCATCIGRHGVIKYKRSGTGTMCSLCPDVTTNIILLVVGFVIMIIGSTVMIYMEITSETSGDESSDAVKKITRKLTLFHSLN